MDEFASSKGSRKTGRGRLNALWLCGFAAWMTAAGAALGAIANYSSKPGSAAMAPTSWPTASQLVRTSGRGTLVMVAHTKCACTRASIHELERVMARAGSRVDAFVVFVGPRDTGVLDLRETARAIPGVRVVDDETEARLFAAATSGQVLLYDQAGALVFRGGITPSRGHEGSSAGGETVRRFVVSGSTAAASAPTTFASEVFGCALFNRNDDAGAQVSGVGKEP